MKHLAYTLAIAGLVGSAGTFATAQSDTDAASAASMTCADFVALSADEQRAALDTLNSTTATNDTEATVDTETDLSANADAGTTGTDTDAGTDLSAQTDTDVDASADTDSAATSAADLTAADPEVAAVIAACAGNDEALVADRMTSE